MPLGEKPLSEKPLNAKPLDEKSSAQQEQKKLMQNRDAECWDQHPKETNAQSMTSIMQCLLHINVPHRQRETGLFPIDWCYWLIHFRCSSLSRRPFQHAEILITKNRVCGYVACLSAGHVKVHVTCHVWVSKMIDDWQGSNPQPPD